jgi:hypothetical protein
LSSKEREGFSRATSRFLSSVRDAAVQVVPLDA